MDAHAIHVLNDAKNELVDLFSAVDHALSDGHLNTWELIDLGLESTQLIRALLNAYISLNGAGRSDFLAILRGLEFSQPSAAPIKGPF